MKQKPNIFVVYDCKKRKSILVTSSARKAKAMLNKGIKIEVWSESKFVEKIYFRTIRNMDKYTSLEKQYIKIKQANAERKNQRRKTNVIRY